MTIIRDKYSSPMIVEMGHFTLEWTQNFVCCVLGLPFKVLNYFVVVRHYMSLLNKSDCSQYFEKISYCPQNVAFYHRLGPRPCIYVNQNPVSEFIEILHKHTVPHFWKWDRFFVMAEGCLISIVLNEISFVLYCLIPRRKSIMEDTMEDNNRLL